MQILHITQGYFPAIGGTERLVQRLSEELIEQFGDQVTVFTTNCYSAEAFFNPGARRLPVGWEEINRVKVRRFLVNRRASQLLRLPQYLTYHLHFPHNDYVRTLSRGPIIPGLERAICECSADVIGVSSFPLLHMYTALQSAKKTRRPCVLIGGLHPEDRWGFDRPMIYRAIKEADAYIAYTDFEADYVIKRGASPDRVSVVGIGVDVEPFDRISTSEAKRRLGLEGYPVVAFIGQLGGHKGVGKLVQAMPMVWSVLPEARCLIAGARTMFADYLESLSAQLSQEDRNKLILIYNFPEADKPWLYAAADIIAYPSGYESFGIAFLEAWAASKPVIGCWRGSTPSVIDAGRDGLLVRYQDEEALAEAIILLLRNPVWAGALGEAGRRKVESRFTWRKIAGEFRQVYQNVLKESEESYVRNKKKYNH